MKNMDDLGLKECSYQADLFEMSVSEAKCSSKIFIRRFMNSELAGRMDRAGILFDALDVKDALKELDAQYGESSYGTVKFSVEEMRWIGYIYRYFAYVEEKSSKQIYKMINPDLLRKLYFPYHSLDPLQAIERIKEAAGQSSYDDKITDIAYGVEVLRRVRNRCAADEVKCHKSFSGLIASEEGSEYGSGKNK